MVASTLAVSAAVQGPSQIMRGQVVFKEPVSNMFLFENSCKYFLSSFFNDVFAQYPRYHLIVTF